MHAYIFGVCILDSKAHPKAHFIAALAREPTF